jgi:hypothetical protein
MEEEVLLLRSSALLSDLELKVTCFPRLPPRTARVLVDLRRKVEKQKLGEKRNLILKL